MRCGWTTGRLKGMGDPKRVVGAYITDVEATEEQQLAAGDAKAQESRGGIVSPDEPASAVLPDNPVETATGPADMFRAAEGPVGLARGRDHRRTAGGRRRRTESSLSFRRRARRAHRLRAPLPVDDFVFGIGIFNAEGVCCYGTNT